MALEGRLEADVSTDGRGSTVVEFSFRVTNTCPDPVELQFSDACKAEFIVTDDGREVWRYTDGKLFAQMLSAERLAPEETATYEAEWTTPRPGGYVATAELRAQETTCEARAEFGVAE